MRHRWLFVSAVVMLGSLASGCSEGKSPLGRLDMQTASSHELELKKLRSSPYYGGSASEGRIVVEPGSAALASK